MKTTKILALTLIVSGVFQINVNAAEENDSVKTSPPENQITVFRPKRELTYKAYYLGATGDTLTTETVMLKRTEDELFLKANWYYDFKKEDALKYNDDPKNVWVKEESVELAETSKKIWMYPPRKNQYYFSAIAPLPYIEYPYEQLRKYVDTTTVDTKNFGQLGKKRSVEIVSDYKFAKQESRTYAFGTLKNCWKVEASGFSKVGFTKTVFYFHPDYGFTEVYITNHDDRKIILILEKSKY